MRWMRELSWRQWLLILPAVAVLLFGVRYTARNWHSAPAAKDEKLAKGKGAKREVASAKKKEGEETYSADDAELHDQLQNAIEHIGDEKGAKVQKDMESDDKVAAAPAGSGNENRAPGSCGGDEIRGDGPALTKVTPDEWGIVMEEFHGVKKNLLSWLERNKGKFSPKAYALMEKQIQDVKLQRPPAADEPDLAYRGVAVLGKDLDGQPMIRMGNGFLKLLVRDPARGKFELARLAAQTWSPCDVQRADGGQPWAPLLKCLGVDEANACGAGSYSEAGWAVSTVLAYKVANPGCAIPALTEANAAACVNQIPFNTSTRAPARHKWTEARR